MDAGFTVHLGNPVAFQQYKGLKHTDEVVGHGCSESVY
jgi:hypothetical protein